jgi:hypothetical protein
LALLGAKTLLVNPPLVGGIAFTRQGRCQEREEVLGTTKPPYTLALAVTNMFFYFVQTFLGPHPPPNTAYYLAFNLPWLIAPAVLGARVFFGKDLRTAPA